MVHISSSGIVTDYHLGYYLQNVVIVINMCNSEGYERVLKKMTSGQLGRSDRYRVRWVSPILPNMGVRHFRIQNYSKRNLMHDYL